MLIFNLTFNLTTLPLWGRTLAKYPQARASAYADDGYIKGKMRIGLEVLADLKCVLTEDGGVGSEGVQALDDWQGYDAGGSVSCGTRDDQEQAGNRYAQPQPEAQTKKTPSAPPTLPPKWQTLSRNLI